MDSATITVFRYTTPDGVPTCSAGKGQTCRFLQSNHFGTRMLCSLHNNGDWITRADGADGTPEHGYLVPLACCEVWK